MIKCRITNLSLIISLSVLFLSGCYYDNKTELYPYQYCDTSKVTYSTFVRPMIINGCGSCHSGTSPSGKILLTTWQQISYCAKSGKLYGSLSGDIKYKQMPQGSARWTSCELQKLNKWIKKGTPND